MGKVTEDDLLDAIAREISSKYPQPGDITVGSFMEEMGKRGHTLTVDQSSYWLNEMVKEGKLTMRYGIVSGRKARIYRKK